MRRRRQFFAEILLPGIAQLFRTRRMSARAVTWEQAKAALYRDEIGRLEALVLEQRDSLETMARQSDFEQRALQQQVEAVQQEKRQVEFEQGETLRELARIKGELEVTAEQVKMMIAWQTKVIEQMKAEASISIARGERASFDVQTLQHPPQQA